MRDGHHETEISAASRESTNVRAPYSQSCRPFLVAMSIAREANGWWRLGSLPTRARVTGPGRRCHKDDTRINGMHELMGTFTTHDGDSSDNASSRADADLERLREDTESALHAGDGQIQVPGVRCRPGIVAARSGRVRPVTDLDKRKAEDALRTAARASADAAAQAICDKGSCADADDRCTFVRIMELIAIASTPSLDAQGRVQWTATLTGAAVAGVCVCRPKPPAKPKLPDGDPRNAFFLGRADNPFYFGVPDGRGVVIVPPAHGGDAGQMQSCHPAADPDACGVGEPVAVSTATTDTCGPQSVEAKGTSGPVVNSDPDRARMQALAAARAAARASAGESCTGGCDGSARTCAYVEASIATDYEIRFTDARVFEVTATALTKGTCRCPDAA